MFVRLLFLLLLALNLGAAAWLLFGHAPHRTFPPPADSGVTELRLWSEVHRSASPSSASTSHETCETLGPFTTTVDMRVAMQTLSPHVARIQYREEQVSQSHGFWVYLPATATREAALTEARQLAAKGVQDYYVVTVGDQQNTVSLGLFSDMVNAQKRLAEVARAGFTGRIKPRVDTEPAYWLDFAVPANTRFDWTAWLPDRNDLTARPIDCF
jgi:SPOR domain